MVFEIITNPDSFFRRRAEEPGFAGPAFTVFLAAVSSTLGTLVLMGQIVSSVSSDIDSLISLGFGLTAISAFFALFLTWIVVSGGLYLVSSRFDASGSFRQTVLLTGWGFLPAIFTGIFSGLLTYYTFQGVVFPEKISELGPFLKQMRSTPFLRLSRLLGLVFTIWQGFIWTFAIKHARSIELRQAALTVAIPTLASLVWKLHQMI